VRIYPTAGDKHKVTDGKKQSKKVSYEETKPVLQNTPIMPEKFFTDAITVHKTRPGISVRRTITVL